MYIYILCAKIVLLYRPRLERAQTLSSKLITFCRRHIHATFKIVTLIHKEHAIQVKFRRYNPGFNCRTILLIIPYQPSLDRRRVHDFTQWHNTKIITIPTNDSTTSERTSVYGESSYVCVCVEEETERAAYVNVGSFLMLSCFVLEDVVVRSNNQDDNDPS